MTGERRVLALAQACALMTEHHGRELAASVAAQAQRESDLRETEHAIVEISAILPQSTCQALRRMAALQDAIAKGSQEIARLRQAVVTWEARRDLLAERARVLKSSTERRRIEEEIFEGLGRGKSEASS